MRPKVLIGYDESPEGEDALLLGESLSDVLEAKPVVATVISHTRQGVDETDFDEAVVKYTEPILAKARQRLGRDATGRHVVNDSVAAGIYELADWEKPSAVVIGSTRHGESGRIQVGTVGGSLLSGIHCSVAVAPRGYAANSRLGSIGVAIDGSSESWRALSAAAYVAKRVSSPLRVMSVMGKPHYVLGGLLSSLGPEEYRDYKEKEWEQVYEDAVHRVPEEISTEPLLLHGDPADALSEAADDVDLLVLGSRGYGPLKGTVLGSVSARIMAAAPRPVMVVPRGAGPTPLEA